MYDFVKTTSPAEYGAVVETGTTAITGNFQSIFAIADATFTNLVATNWSGDTYTGIVLKAGNTIYGAFTAFTLASGSVIAYKSQT